MKRRSQLLLLAASLTLTPWAGVSMALAENASAVPATDLEARRASTGEEYARITRELTISEERVAEIAEEIAAIRKDHASISAALVQAAKTERKLSTEADDIAAKIDVLQMQEAGLRETLRER